ncbi:Uncharacterized protein Fot_54815 [Forsythia ovata]|uniref:Uncharacterized protein n=1 Tax=Forsythia ovata TaxID=205694 RepID=A0ABD1PA89_9LAMI
MSRGCASGSVVSSTLASCGEANVDRFGALRKKAVSKLSSLPATHKSWPSAPLPRAHWTSHAKISAGTTSIGTTPTCRRSQPASPVSRSTTKAGWGSNCMGKKEEGYNFVSI